MQPQLLIPRAVTSGKCKYIDADTAHMARQLTPIQNALTDDISTNGVHLSRADYDIWIRSYLTMGHLKNLNAQQKPKEEYSRNSLDNAISSKELAASLFEVVTLPEKRQLAAELSSRNTSSAAAANSLPIEEKLKCSRSVNTSSAARTTAAISDSAWARPSPDDEAIQVTTTKSEK